MLHFLSASMDTRFSAQAIWTGTLAAAMMTCLIPFAGAADAPAATQPGGGKSEPAGGAAGQEAPARTRPVQPVPTQSAVPYGPLPQQLLDFYQAQGNGPRPVVINIHGGGWAGGSRFPAKAAPFLMQGVSFVSIDYRLLKEAGDLNPPVKAPLFDAARAVQFVRTKAKEWNVDPGKIGLTGSSAGAYSALWVAFHPDMSKADSTDPVERQSTRVFCVGVSAAQTTLDPKLLREWIPNFDAGASAFGVKGNLEKRLKPFDNFLQQREALLPRLMELSPWYQLTADDPPVGLYYGGVPALGQVQGEPLHSPNFGAALEIKCKEVGVPCEFYHAGAHEAKSRTVEAYLIKKLLGKG